MFHNHSRPSSLVFWCKNQGNGFGVEIKFPQPMSKPRQGHAHICSIKKVSIFRAQKYSQHVWTWEFWNVKTIHGAPQNIYCHRFFVWNKMGQPYIIGFCNTYLYQLYLPSQLRRSMDWHRWFVASPWFGAASSAHLGLGSQDSCRGSIKISSSQINSWTKKHLFLKILIIACSHISSSVWLLSWSFLRDFLAMVRSVVNIAWKSVRPGKIPWTRDDVDTSSKGFKTLWYIVCNLQFYSFYCCGLAHVCTKDAWI